MLRAGMGVVMNPNGSYYVPGYCSWLPFSSFTDGCKPPTPDQFLSDQYSSLGPAARANHELTRELQDTWIDVMEEQGRRNPELYEEYKFSLSHPTLSAAFGTGAATRAVDKIANLVTSGDALLIGALAIGGIALAGVVLNR